MSVDFYARCAGRRLAAGRVAAIKAWTSLVVSRITQLVMHKQTQAALWLAKGVFAIHKGLNKQETAMPDPRKSAVRSPPTGASSARDEIKASIAEVEFQRVTGIARTRLDRGELSAGAYAVILERARKARDSADDAPGTA
jgi:hypothetical protein